MKEALIQKKIKEVHEAHGWLVVKMIQTTMNGIPDLLLMKDGRVAFIEVKQDKGKPTPLQEYIHTRIRKKGIDVFITSNPDFHL